MAKKILILTANNGYFGHSLLPWDSLDIKKIGELLQKKYEVIFKTYDQIQNLSISNHIVIYTSSQEPNLKSYYEDILYFLMKKNNTLIPNFDIFKAHDNKGYQELHKKILSIKSIDAKYYANHNIEDIGIDFPVVFKLPDGAGSNGVVLIKNKKELKKLLKKTKRNLYNTNNIFNIIKQYIKKIILLRKVTPKNFEYYRPKVPFILQNFLPDLKFDFKVLVFWDKFYVLKRHTRKSDFRASGSGNFEFIKPDNSLLDYADNVFKQFDVPFLSMDIVFYENTFHLIEFQGIHFGPYTLMFSDNYFQKEGDDWVSVQGKSNLEDEFANSIDRYINNKNL